MHRISAIALVVVLFGCAKTGNEDNTNAAGAPVAYEVERVTAGETENVLDVYSVKIHADSGDTVKLAKFISKKDEYYYLSLTYAGKEQRFMTGAVSIDIDGFRSNYRYSDPYREILPDGTLTAVATLILNNFTVHDMRSAENIRIELQPQSFITISPEGTENVKRFIGEMEASH